MAAQAIGGASLFKTEGPIVGQRGRRPLSLQNVPVVGVQGDVTFARHVVNVALNCLGASCPAGKHFDHDFRRPGRGPGDHPCLRRCELDSIASTVPAVCPEVECQFL